MYQVLETLFDTQNLFANPYTDNQMLSRNMGLFNFEPICVQEDNLQDTGTTPEIDKHVPRSASVSSNLIEERIFFFSSIPVDLVESFVDALDGKATQSKDQMNMKILEVETSVKRKLDRNFPLLNQRHCCKELVI